MAATDQITFKSEILNQEREILIYTPPQYSQKIHSRYDVFYVFDAQNRSFFDLTHSLIRLSHGLPKDFIVVGISAYQGMDQDYARNNDFLPVLKTERSKKRYGPYSGNADNFLAFIHDELVPYIDETYRTLPTRTAVGHSLGGSFILYSMLNSPELFQNYMAISPNFAFEDDYLANAFMGFDFEKLNEGAFIHVSSADEKNYWQEWGPAYDKVEEFMGKSEKLSHLNTHFQKYPDYDHLNAFVPSLSYAIKAYLIESLGEQEKWTSKDSKEVTITVSVPEETEELFVAGNQDSLGNWNPGEVKMEKIAPRQFQITLEVKTPVRMKFTRGGWENQAFVDGSFGDNLVINPKEGETYNYTILGYADSQQ